MSLNTTRPVLRLRVDGMRCRSCEALLGTALRALPGVDAVNVDATAGEITAYLDTDAVSLDAFVRAIVDSGFRPGEPFVLDTTLPQGIEVEPAAAAAAGEDPTAPTVCPTVPSDIEAGGSLEAAPAAAASRDAAFAVTGMTCASCSAVVEKVVGSSGRASTRVNVNLATERMSVTFDPSWSTRPRIADAVKKAGYGAIPLSGGRLAPRRRTPARVGHVATPVRRPPWPERRHGGPQATVTLGLIGMTCSSCAAVIEKTLAQAHGRAVRRRQPRGRDRARSTFDPTVVGLDDADRGGEGRRLRRGAPRRDRERRRRVGERRAARRSARAHAASAAAVRLLRSCWLCPPFLISMVPPFMTVVPTGVATWLANTVGGAWDPMMVMKYLAFALVTPVQFVRRRPVLPGLLARAEAPHRQHGHAHRHRHVGRLLLLGGRDLRTRARGRAGLLRDRRAAHHLRDPGQAARGAREGQDLRRDQEAHGTGRQDRARGARRRGDRHPGRAGRRPATSSWSAPARRSRSTAW